MDLRQLRYFVAVAEHGSISVAAQAVHIAQPALTRQMQALEDELGTALFERTTRGVKLTDAGKQLLTDASRLLDDTAAAKERAQRAGRGEIGHLSIALPVVQTLAPMTAEVLRNYRREVPGVSISLRHLLSEPAGERAAGCRYPSFQAIGRPSVRRDPHLFGEDVAGISSGLAMGKREAPVTARPQRGGIRLATSQ